MWKAHSKRDGHARSDNGGYRKIDTLKHSKMTVNNSRGPAHLRLSLLRKRMGGTGAGFYKCDERVKQMSLGGSERKRNNVAELQRGWLSRALATPNLLGGGARQIRELSTQTVLARDCKLEKDLVLLSLDHAFGMAIEAWVETFRECL